jgi:putative spermidine/putrescine transport system permease protein
VSKPRLIHFDRTLTKLTKSSLTSTADGLPLKQSLKKAERGRRFKALMFVLPLLAFVSVSFVLPIFDMLFRSVDNPVVSTYLPKTIEKLTLWKGKELPKAEVFETLARELLIAKKNRTIGKVAARLNFETSGMRSAINKTVRKIKKV